MVLVEKAQVIGELIISFKTHSTSTSNIDELIERWKITSAGHFENNSDSIRIKLGASDDLQIYHDGSNSHIEEGGTGGLLIKGDSVNIGATSGEFYFRGFENGAVQLRYDNNTKLSTTSQGIEVTSNGTVVASVVKSTGSARADMRILAEGTGEAYLWFDASNGDLSGADYAFIQHQNSSLDLIMANYANDIILKTRNGSLGGGGLNTAIHCQQNGAVELYHDSTMRFTTSTAGVGMVQGGDKLTWPASSGAGPEIYNGGSSNRDLKFNIDNANKYTFHQNGILYQRGATSSNGGAYSSPAPSYPVRVWLSFNDEDNITNGHGGVSSVSDTGTGTFTINFSDTWPDDNYAMAATSGGAGGSRGDDSCITHGATNPGTGSIGIRTRKFTDNNFTNSESAMFVFVR